MSEIPYTALPQTVGKVYKPLVKVILNYKKTHKLTQPITALIDSGADVCFCNDMIGTWLGIQFNKIKEEVEFTAANGSKFKTKPADVNLQVCGKTYETKFYFTDSLPPNTPIILGQIGFFDKNKITFDARAGIITIE